MDFAPSERVTQLSERIEAFLDEHVYPVELELLHALDEEVTVDTGIAYPPLLVELRERAKADGLWNLFLPDEEHGGGLTNWEYGMLCEAMGRSIVAPMVFNCSAPDTGNMEILLEYGTPEHKERWLRPLLDEHMRSCFSMTEPETAGSDPTGLRGRADLDGDEWVINAHKWFTSGAVGASVAIAMVVTDPDAAPHKRASMILVPTDAPGFNLVRPVSVMGHSGGPGHCEIRYEDCRVPKEALLGEQQFVQDFIAKSRIEIDGARLMVLNAAWQMDELGKREARQAISMTKVVAANVVMDVLDRAIQVHGALGVSDDTPLAVMWRSLRMLRLADGPDEVHKMVIAMRELNKWKADEATAAEGNGGAP